MVFSAQNMTKLSRHLGDYSKPRQERDPQMVERMHQDYRSLFMGNY